MIDLPSLSIVKDLTWGSRQRHACREWIRPPVRSRGLLFTEYVQYVCTVLGRVTSEGGKEKNWGCFRNLRRRCFRGREGCTKYQTAFTIFQPLSYILRMYTLGIVRDLVRARPLNSQVTLNVFFFLVPRIPAAAAGPFVFCH